MGTPDQPAASHRRLDIQGLRAIAVLMVVAFHAGLPLPGGYTGVDMFFVISGFVITGLLLRERQAHGHVRFARFYGRRFLRLIPALALMVTVVLIAALVVFNANGPLLETAYTALGAMTLSANFFLSVFNSDYFAPDASSNPLLNTWSLSVEEQFYLVFPALLVAAFWIAHRVRRLPARVTAAAIVAVVTVLSFLVAIRPGLLGGFEVLGGYYGPGGRVWEFTVGVLLALLLPLLARVGRRAGTVLAVSGVTLLVASAVFHTADAPGWLTLLPVAAAAAFISLGSLTEGHMISRCLSVRPLTVVGDWSYSIYLWHWPVITFAVLLYPTVGWLPLAAAVVSFIPAVASYYLVENPLRNSHMRATRGVWFGVATVLTPAFLAMLAIGSLTPAPAVNDMKQNGGATPSTSTAPTLPELPDPIPIINPGETLVGDIGGTPFYSAIAQYPACEVPNLWETAPEFDNVKRCRQSIADAPVDVAIIGDSHAEYLFPGLAAAYPNTNIAYYVTAGEPPDIDDPAFASIVNTVVDNPTIHTVIYAGSWTEYPINTEQIRSVIGEMNAAGKAVYLADDTPFFPFDAYACMDSASEFSPRVCSDDAAGYLSLNESNRETLAAAVAGMGNARVLDVHRYFCDDDVCRMNDGNIVLFRDTDHLNLLGSQWLAARLSADNPDLAAALSRGIDGEKSPYS